MSALTLTQTATAIGPGLTASFLASGGISPYAYLVRANGASGTINGTTGVYTAPSVVSENPKQLYDTIQVTDSSSPALIATAQILVGTPLLLFCDILSNQLGLSAGRCYLWDQKLMQPADSGLYVAVSVPFCKAFGNSVSYDGSGSGLNARQSVNMQAMVDIDIISRGPAARDQKELVLMALASPYSEQQQEANAFYIGKIPPGARFTNLSQIDGAAIPYRYKISTFIQYAVNQTTAVEYFTTFQAPTLTPQP